MRFDRYERMAFTWSERKAAAVRRKQARELEGLLPLFAREVAATHLPVDQVRDARRLAWEAGERHERRRVAASWRRGRRALSALPAEEREACLEGWNKSGCPGTHEYFGDRVWQAYRRLGLVGPGHAGYLAEWDAAVARLQAPSAGVGRGEEGR